MSSATRRIPLVHDARGFVLPGDAACSGCPIPIGLKSVAAVFGNKAILVIPASCTSIVAGSYPGQAVNMSIIHVPFASAAAVASGVSRALKERGIQDVHVIVWAGDGGTADIGMATLSGAAERNEDIIYIMYDNEAYMNTGIQRSSSTPKKAWTTTTPVLGKEEQKKDVAKIMIAHNIPYLATASIGYPQDFYSKLQRAKNVRGFRFIHLHAPCPVGWRFEPQYTVRAAKLAVETGLWILYEYYNGKIVLSGPSRPYMDPSKRKPIREYIELQARFRDAIEAIGEVEKYSMENWEWIKKYM